MYDLVDDRDSMFQNTEKQTTRENFQEIVDDTARMFSLKGHLENNSTFWVNHCDNLSNQKPYIDNIALRFLVNVMTHRVVDYDPDPLPFEVNTFTNLKYQLIKFVENLDLHIASLSRERRLSAILMIICLLFALLSIWVFFK